jgi:aminoglycoside phosphotransferase (APT) family kinase protein
VTERAAEQHQQFLATPPSDEQLAVIVREVAPGAGVRVDAVRPLTGGIASAVHRVDLSTGVSFVVRRFNAALPWHSDERVSREASLLGSLAATPVVAPEVLFADVDGSATGCPMLVLSLLPGASIDPPGDEAWATELASTLAVVHAQDAPFDAEPWLTFWVARDEIVPELAGFELSGPLWDAIVAVRDEIVDDRRTLAHHDFHPGNTLWSAGRVTGVVDWPLAGRGYAAYDAVYCAFDISLSKGMAAGERFLRAYEAVAGETMHDGWRAVVATRALDELDDWLAAYVGVGTALTVEELRANFRTWVDDALKRLG